MREIENKIKNIDDYTKTKEICMQEFLKGRALSIDRLFYPPEVLLHYESWPGNFSRQVKYLMK